MQVVGGIASVINSADQSTEGKKTWNSRSNARQMTQNYGWVG